MNHGKNVPPQQKYTVKQFEQEFPTESACLEYVKEKRWPAGKLTWEDLPNVRLCARVHMHITIKATG